MALVPNVLREHVSATSYGTAAYTPTSFTATANRLLVVRLSGSTASGQFDVGGVTFAGGGYSWHEWTPTLIQAGGSFGLFCTFYWVETGAGGTVALSIDATDSMLVWSVRAVEYAGYDTGGTPIGVTGSSHALTDPGGLTYNLTSTPASDSHVWATACISPNSGGGSVTEGAQFAQAYEVEAGVLINDMTDETSPAQAVVYTDLSTNGIDGNGYACGALEIKAAGGGATVPDAPTSLTTTPGDTQMGLSWTAPASDGGSSLTDYLIQYRVTP